MSVEWRQKDVSRLDTNLQKIHKTSFKYNKLYTNKLNLKPVLH